MWRKQEKPGALLCHHRASQHPDLGLGMPGWTVFISVCSTAWSTVGIYGLQVDDVGTTAHAPTYIYHNVSPLITTTYNSTTTHSLHDKAPLNTTVTIRLAITEAHTASWHHNPPEHPHFHLLRQMLTIWVWAQVVRLSCVTLQVIRFSHINIYLISI